MYHWHPIRFGCEFSVYAFVSLHVPLRPDRSMRGKHNFISITSTEGNTRSQRQNTAKTSAQDMLTLHFDR